MRIEMITALMVLQKLLYSPDASAMDLSQGTCRVNWIQYEQKCYGAFSRPDDRIITWTNSAELCTQAGGSLATIHSAAVNALVYSLSENIIRRGNLNDWGVSIGLTDAKEEGVFVWVDGSPISLTNWEAEPSNTNGNEDCVEMRWPTGQWNDYPCNRTSYTGMVCEKMKTSDSCPSSWTPYRKKCYRVFHGLSSWTVARDRCGREAAILPIIDSAVTNNWVYNLAKDALIGDGYNTPIGLMAHSTARVFVWEDGSKATFLNWAGEPYDKNGLEDCTQMKAGGKWHDVPCDAYTKGYVCETPAAPTSATQLIDESTTKAEDLSNRSSLPSNEPNITDAMDDDNPEKLPSNEPNSTDAMDDGNPEGFPYLAVIGGSSAGLIIVAGVIALVWYRQRHSSKNTQPDVNEMNKTETETNRAGGVSHTIDDPEYVDIMSPGNTTVDDHSVYIIPRY